MSRRQSEEEEERELNELLQRLGRSTETVTSWACPRSGTISDCADCKHREPHAFSDSCNATWAASCPTCRRLGHTKVRCVQCTQLGLGIPAQPAEVVHDTPDELTEPRLRSAVVCPLADTTPECEECPHRKRHRCKAECAEHCTAWAPERLVTCEAAPRLRRSRREQEEPSWMETASRTRRAQQIREAARREEAIHRRDDLLRQGERIHRPKKARQVKASQVVSEERFIDL